jgi:putative ubiquitin-RnfH superfamily antitoxin RatB of RatAB toxin-antitoxin module
VTGSPFRVAVIYAAPGVEAIVQVDAVPGMTVADAVSTSGIVEHLALDRAVIAFAIHGQRVRPETPLTAGDRVELTRPLLVDPKAARRARSRTPGSGPKA